MVPVNVVTESGEGSRVQRASARASVALVTVLLGLSVFAVWSSQATSAASTRAVVASTLADDYEEGARAIAAEESLERKYRLEPGPDVQARYDEATEAFTAAIARVERDGSVGDRGFVLDVQGQHQDYLMATDQLFRATDRGDMVAAQRIDSDEVDPAFGALETSVLSAADRQQAEAIDQLGSLERLEDTTRKLTPAVFLIGLLLASTLAAVTRGHHRLWQRLSDHHEGILASVGEGVIGVDATGEITFANPAAARLVGAEGMNLVGTRSCALTCGSPGEVPHRCVLQAVRDTGTVVTSPTEEFVRVDGTRFPAEVTVAQDQRAGVESGAVLVFRDISQQLAVERMKGQFVSAVSHELRTPLTSIRGALEMVIDGDAGDLPATASKMIATALRGSERLSRLISDIIDVERLDAGSFPLRLVDLEVGPIVDTAVSDLLVLAAESGVSLVVTGVPGASGWIRCDGDRLLQALINLIGNAIKFSPPGSIVQVAAEPLGECVQFSVTDSGLGIAEMQCEAIFERFHQVDVSSSRENAGSGLGLPITKSIVEQHGGRIWVESVLGQGSTFRFTIQRSGGAPSTDRWPLDDVATGRTLRATASPLI